MTKCIFTTCVGYEPSQIINFLRSCRNVFSGEIFVATGHVPPPTLAVLDAYGARRFDFSTYISGIELGWIGVSRYRWYNQIIEDYGVRFDRALLCDSRDLIFQGDPFSFNAADYYLKFFMEESAIQECEVNSGWLKGLYGAEVYEAIKHCTVSCSGTTMGSFDGIAEYLDKMIAEHDRYNRRCGKERGIIAGVDQGFHNYFIHTSKFTRQTLVENRTGEVQSLHHQSHHIFSASGQLLNFDYRICPIVHQYDRHPLFVPALLSGNDLNEELFQLNENSYSAPKVGLVGETEAYSIVQAGEQFLAVAKSLGPVDLFHERLGERELGGLVLTGSSLEEVRARAEEVERAAAVPVVTLVAETDGYSIVQAGGQFLAVAKSLGPVDLFHEHLGERELGGLVLTGSSLEEVRARAEEIERAPQTLTMTDDALG